MNNKIQQNKVIALFVALCMLFSVFGAFPLNTVAYDIDDDPDSCYPDASLVFKGFDYQQGADGNMQVLMDVLLRKIDATGMSFYLAYDPDVVVPSKTDTNEDADYPWDMWSYDTDATTGFPSGFFEELLKGDPDGFADEIDNTDPIIHFDLYPNLDSDIADDGANIDERETVYDDEGVEEKDYAKVFVADGKDLKLGTVSFRVIDPDALAAAISGNTMSNVIWLYEDPLEDGDDGVTFEYINPNDHRGYQKHVATAEWSFSPDPVAVDPRYPEITVPSYTIYTEGAQAGNQTDLIAYLNKYHKTVILWYPDGTYTLDQVTWGDTGADIEIDTDPTGGTYDPKGGTYTVTQKYNSKLKISKMTVHITPVYLLGVTSDKLSKTFPDTAVPRGLDLDLPTTAKPIYSDNFDTLIPPSISLDPAYWYSWDGTTRSGYGTNESALNNDAAFVSKQFIYDLPQATLTTALGQPWLTITKDEAVVVTRNVGDKTDWLDTGTITASVDRVTGVMTITVTPAAGDTIPTGTDFKIYLPNGMVIDTADLGDITTLTNSGTSATIEINTNDAPVGTTPSSKFNANELKTIQSIINLGSSNYHLTATEPNKGESDQKQFTCSARVNYYKSEGTDSAGRNYVLADYSGGKQGMFPVYAGDSLAYISSYISFPDGKQIDTAYHGVSGISGAALGAAKVQENFNTTGVAWTMEEEDGTPIAGTTLPSNVGKTIYLIGYLENYSYTNFGYVQNPDSVYLKIKVTLKDRGVNPPYDPDNEKIKVETEVNGYTYEVTEGMTFNYDTKQVGYTTYQNQEFVVTNLGTEDVNGLSVNIDSTDFILETPVYPTSLQTNDTAAFKIRTTVGLPKGEYEATVTVSSNTKTNLRTFKIKFKVIDDPVYLVEVVSDPSDNSWGHAYIVDPSDPTAIASRTYPDGTTVKVKAVPEPDYEFDEWKIDPSAYEGIMSNYPATNEMEFPIDALNSSYGLNSSGKIVVTAKFKETPTAKLRLDALRDFEADNTTENPLRDTTSKAVKTFDPTVTDYLVIVPYESDQNIVWFKPKYRDIEGTPVDIEIKLNGGTTPIPYSDGSGASAGYIVSGLMDLNVGTNTVTITQSWGTYSKTYTITIERKPALNVDKKYGNSPMGLIYQDTTHVAGDPNWQADAETYFKTNHTYGTYYPDGAGDTTITYYSTDAWGSAKNYDEDPYAIFVYNGQPFVDPGYEKLSYSDGSAYVPDALVTKTIKVDVLGTSGGDVTDDLLTVTSQTVTIAQNIDTTDGYDTDCVVTELASLRIRPGIYSLVYSFTDSDGTTATFSRPVIVLSEKGDVNIDQSVGVLDYNTLYYRFVENTSNKTFLENIIRENAAWSNLLAYRIADVNEDRNANTIDAAEIEHNTAISQKQYYVPLPQTTTDPWPVTLNVETPPTQTSPPSPKATLKMERLGIIDDTDTPGLVETQSDIDSSAVGKILWVGVTVTDPVNLGDYFLQDGISRMDIAFDYDPDILEPWGRSYLGADDLTRWVGEIVQRNFDVGTNAPPESVEFWNNDYMTVDILSASMDYGPDPDNDAWREAARETGYKTAYIPIKPKTGVTSPVYRLQGISSMATPPDKIFLIRVPFKIKAAESATKNPLKLHLGPQTFALGTAESGLDNYGQWEKTDKTIAEINLKNYFDWDGDTGADGTYLTMLEAYPAATVTPDPSASPSPTPDPSASPEPSPTAIPMYRTWDMDPTQMGFDPTIKEYYLSVDYEVTEVELRLAPNINVTVELSVQQTPDPGAAATDPFPTTAPVTYATTPTPNPNNPSETIRVTSPDQIPLEVLDTTMLEDLDGDGKNEEGGYRNIVTITLPNGTDKYILHIRRFLKPYIPPLRTWLTATAPQDLSTGMMTTSRQKQINKRHLTNSRPRIRGTYTLSPDMFRQRQKNQTEHIFRKQI